MSSRAPGDRPQPVTTTTWADAVAVATAPDAFSNAVSRFRQVPNGLDGPAHAEARRLLDPFFSVAELAPLQPRFARIAAELVTGLSDGPFDAVADLGRPFAVRAQSAWLGWDSDIEPALLDWMDAHRAAFRSADDAAHAAVAADFDAIIRDQIARRRARPRDDVTSRLMTLLWDDGTPVADDDVVSVLRNWTGGDLSSIALCIGVLVHWLATHPGGAHALRTAGDGAVDHAIDEILRLDDPFVSSRRSAAVDATVGGCPVPAGERVVIDWRAANRDPAVFADRFAPEEHAEANLVYGVGPHVCPGRGLATGELRVILRALLAAGTIALDPTAEPVREQAPLAGWHTLPVRFDRGDT